MKRFKKWAKKGLALDAVVAMTATSIPMTGLNAEAAGKMGGKAEVEDGLVLHYNFESLKSGTIVNDLSGNGRAGVIRLCLLCSDQNTILIKRHLFLRTV